MELSEKIKIVRKSIRMSQEEFAQELHCSQSIVSAYETGIRKPSYDVLTLLNELIKKHKLKIKLL